MNPANKEKNKSNTSEIFDISKIGKIDLVEAEKIASEEVIFLTETDLIEGLEDFELVPVKNYKNSLSNRKSEYSDQPQINSFADLNLQKDTNLQEKNELYDISNEIQVYENIDDLNPTADSGKSFEKTIDDLKEEPAETIANLNDVLLEVHDKISRSKGLDIDLEISTDLGDENWDIEEKVLPIDHVSTINVQESEVITELTDELLIAKKLFTVKINEETLDAQLASILNIESFHKNDEKIINKYNDLALNTKCRFIDDQFINKTELDNSSSYNEDPLTERLVKMIEVADGKLQLMDITTTDGGYSNYILEDYTLYDSEKFDNVFKEEAFYIDSDFEFIDNAIIRDDFTKYIHEIDDYFGSEESLIQSEISEILGLIPEENEYIEDKLFGDYYKRYDLDNEIDFIKPEIDFFRSSYTGIKNLSYFIEDDNNLLDSEKWSIEEDISSPNAIVFEESIFEIENILKNDYGYESDNTLDAETTESSIFADDIPDITDNIIILEDKAKLMEFASEFQGQNDNLVKLLSYLDGLFEKLPEEVIRKFAESEYFELYSKVLKEMGV